MSSDVRVSMLVAGAARADDAETVCRRLRALVPYCRIQVHTIDAAAEFDDANAHVARAIVAALRSDVVLYFGADEATAKAGLIALRERAAFSVRLTEPDFARVWFSANRKRSLYVVGALPGAMATLALALELGLGDDIAAARLRGDTSSYPVAV